MVILYFMWVGGGDGSGNQKRGKCNDNEVPGQTFMHKKVNRRERVDTEEARRV